MKLLEVLCKELGVEIGEEWIGEGVYRNAPKYKIDDNKLMIFHKFSFEDAPSWKEAPLSDYISLVKGELTPVHLTNLTDKDLYDDFWL